MNTFPSQHKISELTILFLWGPLRFLTHADSEDLESTCLDKVHNEPIKVHNEPIIFRTCFVGVRSCNYRGHPVAIRAQAVAILALAILRATLSKKRSFMQKGPKSAMHMLFKWATRGDKRKTQKLSKLSHSSQNSIVVMGMGSMGTLSRNFDPKRQFSAYGLLKLWKLLPQFDVGMGMGSVGTLSRPSDPKPLLSAWVWDANGLLNL